jgi:hypothetical protein
MAEGKEHIRVLSSKQAIMDYIAYISGEPCTDYMLRKFIKKGLPARYEDNRWLAHVENIEAWFKKYTFVTMAKDVDSIEQ